MKRNKSKRGNASRAFSHDRRVGHLGINADVASIVVDDPYATQSGETIVVTRQLRGDPLARLHSHRQIDDAQYYAGRAFQRDWEVAERGMCSLDPTREAVDSSLVIDPLTDKQVSAQARLAAVRAALGRKMHAAVHAILIDGATIEALANVNGRAGETWLKYYGRFFRDALDVLAVEYGFAGRRLGTARAIR
jgi:hypothetical protein